LGFGGSALKRIWPSRRTGVLLSLLVTVSACGSGNATKSVPLGSSPTVEATSGATTSHATAKPCGTTPTAPKRYDHVLWIILENHSASQVIGSPSAPYETSLSKQCGLYSAYYAVTHPSLPNYLAMTGGTTAGVTDDRSPAAHPLSGPSIFSEVTATGKTWKSYQESMSHNCARKEAGAYAVKHNPAAYYTGIRSQCAIADVPMGTVTSGPLATDLAKNSLPSFSLLTPNLCNDAHSCELSRSDAWLQSWMTAILTSPAYKTQRTAVFITWDEDDKNAKNRVANIVVAPSVAAGATSSTNFNHYSMLRTTLEMLGLPISLGAAETAPSMRAATHL
jgi:phosphatidylinositol-3-phosphatase